MLTSKKVNTALDRMAREGYSSSDIHIVREFMSFCKTASQLSPWLKITWVEGKTVYLPSEQLKKLYAGLGNP